MFEFARRSSEARVDTLERALREEIRKRKLLEVEMKKLKEDTIQKIVQEMEAIKAGMDRVQKLVAKLRDDQDEEEAADGDDVSEWDGDEVNEEGRMLGKDDKPADEDTKDGESSAALALPREDENLPILRSTYFEGLRSVAEKLDPPAFLRLISSSRKFLRLALTGALRTPLALKALSYEAMEGWFWGEAVGSVVVLLYNSRPLTFKDLSFLNKNDFFRVELEFLSLDKEIERGEDVLWLLEFVRVKRIQHALIECNFDVHRLLQMCVVKNLKVSSDEISASFLLSPNIKKVENLYVYVSQEPEDIKITGDFLHASTNPKIDISIPMPTILVFPIVQAWMAGEKNFNAWRFRLEEEEDGFEELFGALKEQFKVLYVPEEVVMEGDTNVFLEQAKSSAPVVVHEYDNVLWLIRNSEESMQVIYSTTGDYHDVTMAKEGVYYRTAFQ